MMKLRRGWTFVFIATVACLLFTKENAQARRRTDPIKRLRSPAIVRGFVGGDSHDSYVIHARKGQVLTVQLSWKNEEDDRAEFGVSRSPNFYEGEPVKFGKKSDGGKRWSGKIPKTSDYYISVVAHPTANYTLEVRLQPGNHSAHHK